MVTFWRGTFDLWTDPYPVEFCIVYLYTSELLCPICLWNKYLLIFLFLFRCRDVLGQTSLNDFVCNSYMLAVLFFSKNFIILACISIKIMHILHLNSNKQLSTHSHNLEPYLLNFCYSFHFAVARVRKRV